MGNKLNPFEEEIKKAADRFEAPYSPAAWEKLSHELDVTSSGGAMYMWGVSVFAVVAIMMGGYFYLSNQTPSTEVIETELISENQSESVTSIPVVEENQNSMVEVENIDDSKIVLETRGEETITKGEEENQKEVPSKNKEEEKVVTIEPKKKETIPLKKTEKLYEEEFQMPEIVIDNNTLCVGVDLMASLSHTTDEDIIWSMGDGEMSEGTEPNHKYSEAGTYVVQAMLASDHSIKSNAIEVIVNPKPDASFTMNSNLERGVVPVVYFTANERGEKYYQWNLGDGISFSGEGTSHTFTKGKDYEISLKVMNKYGCFQSSYQRLTIEKDYNLLAPNSFTPNGDDNNDEWMPAALSSGYYNFELVVFDRNQKQVFVTSDSQTKFTGVVNGSLAPSGEMFLWKAYVVDPNGVKQQYGGTIILIY